MVLEFKFRKSLAGIMIYLNFFIITNISLSVFAFVIRVDDKSNHTLNILWTRTTREKKMFSLRSKHYYNTTKSTPAIVSLARPTMLQRTYFKKT